MYLGRWGSGVSCVSKLGVVSSFVLGAMLALGVVPVRADVDRYRDDGWDLGIDHDRFSGLTRCALSSSNHRIRYQPGAIGFRVATHRDTLRSWYRVDDGPAVRWQDRTAELIAKGVSIDGPGLDDPTGGWVWIPLPEVERSNLVMVRAGDADRPRRYRMRGFIAMLEASHRLGCSADDSFRI